MSLIRFQNVSKQFDKTPVLREGFFRLNEGDRVGLIGKNGSGKTTVLKMILDRETPTEGEIDIDENLRIGYFSQFSELTGERSIEAILNDLFGEIHTIANELRDIEDALSKSPEGDELNRLLARYEPLLANMERLDGWNIENKIDTALSRLSFNKTHRTLPVDQLSGGWRNRAALAKILLETPDVLLLDEPTNFLDFNGIAWLENWLEQFSGAAIIVSHDRHFLDSAINRIVEIENYHFQEYTGGFVEYVRQKQVRIKKLEKQFQHEEERLAHENEAIRNRKEDAKEPSKALLRRLANIKHRIEPRSIDGIVTDIYRGLRVQNELCEIKTLSKSYDNRTLFSNLSFELQRGDRLVILGPNGCGKSTLINILNQNEEPDQGGVVWKLGDAFIHYNTMLETLDPKDTVSHAVNFFGMGYDAQRKKVHRFLHLLQLTEMNLTQRISTLSDGQQARVALAMCLLSGAPVIILDEPTNHLDVSSTQVMERALIHFPGAVIVASHDRFFIDKVATRLLVFDESGNTELINGNWTIWQANQDN